MHMALRTRRWKRADLLRLPDDGNRYEVVDGELFVTPAPSPAHERILLVLAERLRQFLAPLDLGDIHQGRSAVVLGNSQVEPDLLACAVVVPPPATWDEMPRPFLVVEVLSPTTSRRDQIAKRALYEREGIPEYWIVDGATRTIRVVSAGRDAIESTTVFWQPPGASVTLELDVASLFREALGPGA